MYAFLKRTVCALLLFTLGFAGVSTGSVQAAPANDAIVYYVSNGDLYSVKTAGGPSVKIRGNFDGHEIKPAGDYMYYMYDETSTTLLRFSLTDTKALSVRFNDDMDIVHFETVGDILYFMNDKGGIVFPLMQRTFQKLNLL